MWKYIRNISFKRPMKDSTKSLWDSLVGCVWRLWYAGKVENQRSLCCGTGVTKLKVTRGAVTSIMEKNNEKQWKSYCCKTSEGKNNYTFLIISPTNLVFIGWCTDAFKLLVQVVHRIPGSQGGAIGWITIIPQVLVNTDNARVACGLLWHCGILVLINVLNIEMSHPTTWHHLISPAHTYIGNYRMIYSIMIYTIYIHLKSLNT